jgi:hypothetical protein
VKKVIVGESDLKPLLIYCASRFIKVTFTNALTKVIGEQDRFICYANFLGNQFEEAQKLCPTLAVFLNK